MAAELIIININQLAGKNFILQSQITEYIISKSNKFCTTLRQINDQNSKQQVEECVVREVIETQNFAYIDSFQPNEEL